MLADDLRIVVNRNLASKVLAQGATMEERVFGKQCANTKCDDRGERVLASNALVRDVTIKGSRYWQAMHWHKMRLVKGAGIGKKCAGMRRDYRGEWVLASNVLAQDATI
jgi:hypothetical protein